MVSTDLVGGALQTQFSELELPEERNLILWGIKTCGGDVICYFKTNRERIWSLIARVTLAVVQDNWELHYPIWQSLAVYGTEY